MYVGKPGTGQPRFEIIEAFFRYVEGIHTPLRMHQSTDKQRLAAGACTKIHDHVTPLWCKQQTEKLTPFVLHFHFAFEEQGMGLQRRLALQSYAHWRKRRRRCPKA